MTEMKRASSAARPVGVAALIAFVLVSLNMRIAFGGVGPVLPYMQLDPLVAAALTAFPALCMGLFAPLGAVAGRRFGEERALFLAVLALTLGILLRSMNIAGLLVGTIVASGGIAALNVLMPVFVRQQFPPDRIGVMMGLFAMMMASGGTVMAALAVPLYGVSGESWQVTLGVAAVPAALALVALLPLLGASSRPEGLGLPARPWRWLLAHPTVWSLIGFFRIQSLVFYAVLAWLPTIYVSRGAAPAMGGIYLATWLVAVTAGSFLGPTLAARRNDHRRYILLSILACIAGLVGVVLAPLGQGLFWSTVLGLGMGAGQGLPGVLYAKRTADHAQMTQLSGMVQTVGYLVAGVGPLVATVLFRWSGGWTWPLAVFVVLLVFNAFASLHCGRDHVIAMPERA